MILAVSTNCPYLPPSADLESSQKQVEADKKAIDELTRERDILNKVPTEPYTHIQPKNEHMFTPVPVFVCVLSINRT